MKIRCFAKSICLLLNILGISFSAPVFAGGIEMPPIKGLFFSMLGGANFETSGTTASVNLAGLVTNLYVANNHFTTGPMLGADIGYRWFFHQESRWFSLAAESSYTVITSPYGKVRPLFFINANFDTLNFNYEVQSMPLFAVFTMGRCYGWFEPYVVGGLGVSWNQAFNYNEVPTDPDATALPMRTMFRIGTRAEFAWTAGAGFGFRTTDTTNMGLEYRYTNYGNAALDPAAQQSTSQRLNLGKIQSNALLARLTITWAQ